MTTGNLIIDGDGDVCIDDGRKHNLVFCPAVDEEGNQLCPDVVLELVSRFNAVEMARAAQDAAQDVLAERARQISEEGWTPEHDDCNDGGEMAQAAACYALNAAGWQTGALRGCWPMKWMASWFKTTSPRRDLVKAGALILAEIERHDRAALRAIAGGE